MLYLRHVQLSVHLDESSSVHLPLKRREAAHPAAARFAFLGFGVFGAMCRLLTKPDVWVSTTEREQQRPVPRRISEMP